MEEEDQPRVFLLECVYFHKCIDASFMTCPAEDRDIHQTVTNIVVM